MAEKRTKKRISIGGEKGGAHRNTVRSVLHSFIEKKLPLLTTKKRGERSLLLRSVIMRGKKKRKTFLLEKGERGVTWGE